MTGFTPGPWKAYNGHDHHLGHWVITAETTNRHARRLELAVARILDGKDGNESPEAAANARLIAAAPEMWESVQADHALDEHRLNHHGCPVDCLERASLWSIAREKRVAAIAKAEGGGT